MSSSPARSTPQDESVPDRSHEFPRWLPFDEPKCQIIEQGKWFSAFVSYVDDRGVIWATPSEIYDGNLIHAMTEKTQVLFKDQQPVDLGGDLEIGQGVMAQYDKEDDDKWSVSRLDQFS
jgi:hypothetical protein